MGTGEIILYTTQDGGSRINLRASGGTVWLSQAEMAELFQTTPQNMTLHIKSVYSEGELPPESTCKESLQVRSEGGRDVQRTVKVYSLDMILAVGYRVKSPRGTQFRQWATTHLREYLVKGFVMDDERMKDPGGRDYFDELLRRIKEIRASEKRFFQKVRDIYATAVDYNPSSKQAQEFFAKVQNKMIWAVSRNTAAEIVVSRSDPSKENMGLQSWSGHRVTKQDVTIAKNYLRQPEIEELNSIVVMYLEHAEDQARRRKAMTMQEWAERLDAFLSFNERDVLTHAGRVTAKLAEARACERYAEFDSKRREEERLAADAEDLASLEALEEHLDRVDPHHH